ncbi:uncharacterized protein LOC141674671 [Apium graveolens]|uniref:uncharacterized protein LOC141674671 n=1 Tax=Apium graveolens TaxID=4045 RepID=UPI003D7B7FE3
MNAIAWNCRGVGSARTVRVLKEMIKSHKPDLLFLSETLEDSNKVASLAPKISFVNFYSVDKQGRGGGLAIFRSNKLNYSVFYASNNHIDVQIHESSDKKGKHGHLYNVLEGFRSVAEDSSLIEVELTGGEYTWEKSKGTSSWVRERLDRCFANDSWWSKFPLCTLTVFYVAVSDHDPIKLDMLNTFISKKNFRFRFENTWLKEPNFYSEISNYWQHLPAMHLLPKLVEISKYMAQWGREVFHKFRDKIMRQKKIIDDLKDREDDDGVQMYFEEKDKFHELLIHEETYWQQRVKKFWLKEGDTNSKFFHKATSSRKKLNHIGNLKTEMGWWCQITKD